MDSNAPMEVCKVDSFKFAAISDGGGRNSVVALGHDESLCVDKS